jgi:hypothetical protein
MPARGPPAWDDAPEPMPDWDLRQQPESDFEPLLRLGSAHCVVAAVSVPQETVQPRSSASGALRRRCSPQHPETRTPTPRATSISPAVGG